MEHTKNIYLALVELQKVLSESTYKLCNYYKIFEIWHKGEEFMGLCGLSTKVANYMFKSSEFERYKFRHYLKYRMWGPLAESYAGELRWTASSRSGFYSRKKFVDKLVKELEVHYAN